MHKKDLEIFLSHLQTFSRPRIKLEQYATPSAIAADLLWDAYQKGHIEGKIIADLGCGTGILGVGALFLGAKKVFFVDIDQEALVLAKENVAFARKTFSQGFSVSFSCMPVGKFTQKVSVVFQNPPFGTKTVHADKAFLEIAFSHAPLVYSFHKFSTKSFVEGLAEHYHFSVLEVYRYKLPLKAQFSFHTSRVKTIDVGCWCFQKN